MSQKYMNLPKAKLENVVVQPLNDEVLIYNLTTNQAFCLNETSAKIFNVCNGETSFEQLKRQYKFNDELIYLALNELKANNLIEDYLPKFADVSRRELIKRVGLASTVALPVISALVAPTAVHAQSVCFADGTTNNIPVNCAQTDANCFIQACTSACCSRNVRGITNNGNGTETCTCG